MFRGYTQQILLQLLVRTADYQTGILTWIEDHRDASSSVSQNASNLIEFIMEETDKCRQKIILGDVFDIIRAKRKARYGLQGKPKVPVLAVLAKT